MSDIVVDESYLSGTITDLDNLSSDLSELCSTVRGMDGLVVGAAPVFDEIHEFGGKWSRTAEDLSEDATKAADYLRLVLEVFAEVDLQIAQQFLDQMEADG